MEAKIKIKMSLMLINLTCVHLKVLTCWEAEEQDDQGASQVHLAGEDVESTAKALY